MLENIFYLFSTCILPIILLPLKIMLFSLWDICSYFIIDVFMGISNTMICKSDIIKRGYILVNNGSKIDIIFNTYKLEGVIYGKGWLDFYCMGIIGLIEERIIFGKKITNIIKNIEKKNNDECGNRVIIYGKNRDKILKEIYDNGKYPIQIFLSKGNKIIISILSEPIYPGDYREFNEFMNKIDEIWNKNYKEISM